MIKWLEKKRIIPFIITFLITIEIFYFSSLSLGTGVGGGNPWIPRIYHFIVFFLFAFFLFITIKGNNKIKIKHFLIVLFVSIFHAILDEIHQLFVPFRNFSIKDILTNTAGIFFSMIIYLYINKKSEIVNP